MLVYLFIVVSLPLLEGPSHEVRVFVGFVHCSTSRAWSIINLCLTCWMNNDGRVIEEEVIWLKTPSKEYPGCNSISRNIFTLDLWLNFQSNFLLIKNSGCPLLPEAGECSWVTLPQRLFVPSLLFTHCNRNSFCRTKWQEEPRPLIFYSHLEVVTVPFLLHVPYHFSKRGVHINAQKPLPESWMLHGNENNARNPLHLYKLL